MYFCNFCFRVNLTRRRKFRKKITFIASNRSCNRRAKKGKTTTIVTIIERLRLVQFEIITYKYTFNFTTNY